MARRDGASTSGVKVIAAGALRCSNATCTALPRSVYALTRDVSSDWRRRMDASLAERGAPRRTELDLTRADVNSRNRRRCNVCSALDALGLLCEREGIDGADPLRAFDEGAA